MELTTEEIRIEEMANHLLEYPDISILEAIEELRGIWYDSPKTEMIAAYRLAFED